MENTDIENNSMENSPVLTKVLKIQGGYYGLLSVSLEAMFLYISYILNPGYNLLIHYISLLGIAPGPASWFFNLGIIIAGVLLTPFYIYIGRILKREDDYTDEYDESRERIRKGAVVLSVIGAVSMALVGFFPMYNPFFGIFHTLFAGILFVFGIISSICFGLLILRDDRIHNFHGYFFFLAAASVILFFLTASAWAEWSVLFVQAILIVEFSVYTLYKKY